MRRILAAAASVTALVLVATGCTDMDQETSPDPSLAETAEPPSALPDVAPALPLAELEAFSGVATMNAGGNCTGTLIDTGVPTGPAYVLTNGHCVGDIGRSAQGTTTALEWFGDAEFFRAEGNLENTYTVPVVELAYSTMRLTDTGIVRLDATLGELEQAGVNPVPIADAEPAGGASVVNIGVPVQDLMDYQWVMRKGACTLGEQHTLIEFHWLWQNVWSNDCPGIIQGSSGSPLFQTDAAGAPAQIVAMINTTSWGTSQAEGGACAINRPCQVDADGTVTMVEETSYAQSVAGIGRCFDSATGEFSLSDDCPLPTSSIWTTSGGGTFQGGTTPNVSERVPWANFVGATVNTFRYSLVPLGDGGVCTDPATYAQAPSATLEVAGEAWEDKGTLVEPVLPDTEGWYLLCAVNGDDYAGAASVIFQVDETPPIFPADASLERQDDGAVIIHPHFNPPEISTIRYVLGPEGTVDCDDTDAFQSSLTFFTWVEPADMPATYCLFGLDAAGNRSPVTQIDIPAP
ncbi:MAG: serine protease [Demequina sp.]|jgi:V8-like Glu-specific endopeptidase|nr:serine protease [Demequina sp.]